MRRNPHKQLLAVALALLLGLALVASKRDEFPGRRQGGGSRGEFPAEVDYGA